MWHDAQSLAVPWKRPPGWQLSHVAARCAPVSGNPVRAWSKRALFHVLALWHDWHSVGKPPAT
jgi:hypothetical protein